MSRTADINFKVTLDNQQMPEKIEWDATDSGGGGIKNCEAMLISLWDKETRNTLGIDLWTKEMMVDDMNVFVYQTLLKLAETYRNSTKNQETSKLLSDCAAEFGEKINSEK